MTSLAPVYPFVAPGTTSQCSSSTPIDACPPHGTPLVSSSCSIADLKMEKLNLASTPSSITDSPASVTTPASSKSSLVVPLSPEGENRLAAINKFTLNPNEPQRSLQELVHALMEELEGGKKDLNRLWNIMMSYDASANEWKRYEFIDANKKYTRNLIASVPGSFCLMLLCWNPEKGSPIHNHAGSECFMRVIEGAIVEKQYVVRGGEGDQSAKCNWNKIVCSNIPPSDLERTSETIYSAGGVTFINDSLGVHQVENPYKESAVTLHAYIPGYDTCKSWCEDASACDADKKVKVQLNTISFDTEQGERVSH